MPQRVSVKAPARVLAAVAASIFIGLFSRPALSQTGSAAFTDIARVLQSPRCMNCHPAGDAPLQGDQSRPHKQNIKRIFSSLGGSCNTCHQDAALPGAHMPPGALHWKMPPAETPMVFQGKTPAQLCTDLKDPNKNGHRSLDDLVRHVTADPLVLWGFNPGGGRTTPPMTHDAFVRLVTQWAALGAPCPN